MKKEITYLELLQMVKEGKQPERIEYYGRVFKYADNTYFEESVKEHKYYLTNVLISNKEGYLAKERMFSYEVEILDEKEKEYLKAVIKPFRNRVKTIERRKNKEWERIVVFYKDYDDISDSVCSFMSFPMFIVGTMYRGMEIDKRYTLEELGI